MIRRSFLKNLLFTTMTPVALAFGGSRVEILSHDSVDKFKFGFAAKDWRSEVVRFAGMPGNYIITFDKTHEIVVSDSECSTKS